MKAALYARFSSDKQSEASIDDQFRICERIADAEGFDVVARFSDAAITGGTAADEVKEKLFHRLLGGLSVEDVDRRSAVFAHRHLQRHLRADARRRLEWHQRQGHYTVIVSASPECYVSPAGEELGVDGVVATRLAVGGGGLLTGGYEGKNCRGAEKYARLIGHLRARGLLSNNGGEQPVLWAYGNSRGDLRLLNAADHGVDAGRLGPLGRLRRFPRLAEVAAVTGDRQGLPVRDGALTALRRV